MDLRTVSQILKLSLLWMTFGCAAKFQPLQPSAYYYPDTQVVNDSLQVSYRYNIQELAHNERYDQKETHHAIASIAVRIQNVSPNYIVITRDNFMIRSALGFKEVLSADAYSRTVKQRTGWYSLYFFAATPGLLAGLFNYQKAVNANHLSAATYKQFEIWGKSIKPGGTLCGVIPLQTKTKDKLTFIYYPKEKWRTLYYYAETANPAFQYDSTRVKIDSHDKSSTKNPISRPYTFFVMLKNSTSYSCNTKIDISSSSHFIIANNKDAPEVKPSDTKFLLRLTTNGKQLVGIPADSCWLFKVISGRINAYYFLAEDGKHSISHIQNSNGPIVPFSIAALKEMVGDDEEINKLLFKQRYVKAIKAYNARHRTHERIASVRKVERVTKILGE